MLSTIERRLTCGFLVALASFAFLAHAILTFATRSSELTDYIAQSHIVKSELDVVATLVARYDENGRRYRETRDGRYLSDQIADVATIGRSLDRLAALSHTGASQRKDVDRLRTLVSRRLSAGSGPARHSRNIRASRAGTARPARATPASADYLEPIEQQIAAMRTEVDRTILRREESREAAASRRITASLGIVLAPTYILLATSYLGLLRQSERRREIDHLREAARQRHYELLDSLADAFVALDGTCRVVHLNAAAERLFRARRDAVRGRPVSDLWSWTHGATFEDQCSRAISGAGVIRFEVQNEQSGQWFAVHASPTDDGLSLFVSDISPQKLAEQRNERLLAILDATPDLVALYDGPANFYYLNPAGRKLLGLDAANPTAADLEYVLETVIFRIGHEHGVWSGERTLVAADRRQIPVSQVIVAHRGADGQVDFLSTIARDISERKLLDRQLQHHMAAIETHRRNLEAANRQLEELATTDGLTGIKNHRAFQERLLSEVARSARSQKPLTVALIDVDCFKAYNDAFGHPAGDEALRRIATLLGECVRKVDVVARYGGEEFAVLLPDTPAARACSVMERVRSTIERDAWERRQVTVSVGLATAAYPADTTAPPGPPHTEFAAQLVAAADRALYTSKSLGRNRVTEAADLDGSDPGSTAPAEYAA